MNTATVTNTNRGQRSYKRVYVRKPITNEDQRFNDADYKPYTTISLKPAEFAKALKFAYGDARRVTDAIRHVAKEVKPEDCLPGDFSLVVRRKALARLRGQYRPALAAEIAAKDEPSVEAESFAAANNEAWATA